MKEPITSAVVDNDLLEVVRTFCAIAARMRDLAPEKRRHYPLPTEEGSPVLMAARAACMARGYTEDGLAVNGVVYPVAAQAGQVAVPESEYTTHHFRKKPVVIEAVQFVQPEMPDVPKWLTEAVMQNDFLVADSVAYITTLEGIMAAQPGDWIIRGVKGEIYPCKPEIFAATYERAAAPASPAVAQHAPADWISVDDRLPDAEYCLATYRNRHGKLRVIRAKYARQFEIDAGEDAIDHGNCEYNEADDTYYLKAGWLECIDNWDDYSSVYVTEGEVTHWTPLPPLPAAQASTAGESGQKGGAA